MLLAVGSRRYVANQIFGLEALLSCLLIVKLEAHRRVDMELELQLSGCGYSGVLGEGDVTF